jgi:hypothetical protein
MKSLRYSEFISILSPIVIYINELHPIFVLLKGKVRKRNCVGNVLQLVTKTHYCSINVEKRNFNMGGLGIKI